MTPADRKCRSWRSCWPPASPICARWKSAGVALEDAQRHDLCAAFRRCRPVPDAGKIPRAALVVGADRTGLRPDAEAIVHRRRYRVADADAARSLCEHAARDDGDVLRRSRRRQRHHRAAAHAGAGIARSVRAACGAQHATGAAGRIQPRQGVRSRGRLRRHRNPDAGSSAKPRGRCFRRSRRPAACLPRSSKT